MTGEMAVKAKPSKKRQQVGQESFRQHKSEEPQPRGLANSDKAYSLLLAMVTNIRGLCGRFYVEHICLVTPIHSSQDSRSNGVTFIT